MDSYIDVDAAIAVAEKLIKDQRDLHASMAIVRTDLRNAVQMKATNAEQTAFVKEHFPIRTRVHKPKAEAK